MLFRRAKLNAHGNTSYRESEVQLLYPTETDQIVALNESLKIKNTEFEAKCAELDGHKETATMIKRKLVAMEEQQIADREQGEEIRLRLQNEIEKLKRTLDNRKKTS